MFPSKEEIYATLYNEDFKTKLLDYLSIRTPILHIREVEEKRFLRFINLFSIINNYRLYFWDAIHGSYKSDCQDESSNINDSKKTLIETLAYLRKEFSHQYIKDLQEKGIRGNIYVIHDLHLYLNDPVVYRYLQEIHSMSTINCVIMVDSCDFSNNEISKIIPTFTVPVPSLKEYEEVFEETIKGLAQHPDIMKTIRDQKNTFLSAFLEISSPLFKAQESLLLTVMEIKRNLKKQTIIW